MSRSLESVIMNSTVKTIQPGSPAAKSIIAKGDILCKINGNAIGDVLDYEYYSYDSRLLLEFTGSSGRVKLVWIYKPEGADIGLEFESYLMDMERSCANNCIFCFIDQLPRGMRESLYYKDDDVRLSFLQGSYVTLTNLSRHDINRIIKLRISPINVSVHTLDSDLRSFMIGSSRGGKGLAALKALARAGITLNCQIVCCPKINDGRKLSETIKGFIRLGECINSVSVVPVGLTKHRQGLTELNPFDKELALKTVRQIERYADRCKTLRGARVFFCADELYMLAGLALPPDEYYEGYPQLENGVGMMRLFISEFEEALMNRAQSLSYDAGQRVSETDGAKGEQSPVFDQVMGEQKKLCIVTGILAHKYLTNILIAAKEKYGTIACEVYAIRNDFFGESVTVSGLVTGGDIISQLRGKNIGSKMLIPQNMLRYGSDVFLDDVTVDEVSSALGAAIRIVKQDGADLLQALLER